MTDENNQLVAARQDVQPADIIAGLGLADRELLATCLALFEDSTLSKRIEQLYRQASSRVRKLLAGMDIDAVQWLGDASMEKETASVETRKAFWEKDPRLTDDDRRLILWIYLREAFDLPARLSVSTRGADALATELAAAAIHAADPPSLLQDGKNLLQRWGWIEGKPRCIGLADVVLPVLDDLIATALKNGAGQMDAAAAQARLIAETRARLEGMSKPDQQRLLDKIGAKDFNDAAIRNMLLTGGGLAAINVGVGAAGFSAYILAAKVSAFIPMVSGPALVSFLSVISNPVTIIGGTAAAIWWATSSAKRKVQTAVGLRVLALLALKGLSASNRDGFAVTLNSFSRAKALEPTGDLDEETAKRYRDEWHALEPAVGKPGLPPDTGVMDLMNRPTMAETPHNHRLASLLFPGDGEPRATAAVAALTLGDIAYSAAAIDPTVIKAADFSHVGVLDNRLAFADLARKIQELSPTRIAGGINREKGYVAEQVVAAELVAKGHQVEFPSTSIEPGWDLLVDGEKFQVKCLEGIGGLEDHFDKYTYPVLANSELADKIPCAWADKVFFVEGCSNDLISHVTKSSMVEGAEVFNPGVPVFALVVSAIRNLMSYNASKVSGTQAVEQVVLDGSARAGLAVAGGYLGTGIGLLVFGPAGALVWGSVLPVLAQAQASRLTGLLDEYIQTEAYTRWAAEAHSAIDALVTCLYKAIADKIQRLGDKCEALGAGQLSTYVRYRFTDDECFLRESQARLAQLGCETCGTVERRALDVIRWTAHSTIHPAQYQAGLARLNETLKRRPLFLPRLIGPPSSMLDDATGAIGAVIRDGVDSCVAGIKAGLKNRW